MKDKLCYTPGPMRKFILILWPLAVFLFCGSFGVAAQAQESLCYQSERDPRTDRPFENQEDYDSLTQSWNQRSPGLVNPLNLLKAYSVYKREVARAKKMGNDKQMHCYLGCRIAQETHLSTVDYVGWLKESRDLSDCNLRSRFEEEDYLATLRGGQYGEANSNPESCERACR